MQQLAQAVYTGKTVRDDEDDQEFGKRLARVRGLRGDTQLDLAKALGVHPAQVSRWEIGTRGPTATWYRKILRHYHTEAMYLIHGDDPPQPTPNPALERYLATDPGKMIKKHGKAKQLAAIAQVLASPGVPTDAIYARVGGLLVETIISR